MEKAGRRENSLIADEGLEPLWYDRREARRYLPEGDPAEHEAFARRQGPNTTPELCVKGGPAERAIARVVGRQAVPCGRDDHWTTPYKNLAAAPSPTTVALNGGVPWMQITGDVRSTGRSRIDG